MIRREVKGRRLQVRAKRFGPAIHGGSLFKGIRGSGGQRDDVFKQEELKNSLPKGELGQSNMDATIKRNLIRKKNIIGNLVSKKEVTGGTMMDPLESVRLPKFVGGKKQNRNNIKISL